MSEAVDIAAGRLKPEEYAANFDDIDPPLDRRRALVESSRCYFCHDAPCIEACPTGIDIPAFIRGIQTDNVKGAALEILEANIMGGACARVCPTEILCEGACVRQAQESKPVNIGLLQRYATDWLYEQGIQPFQRAAPTGKRVAVIGAGPAGLACAHALACRGHDIDVYERRPKPGGLNEYGIAAYKVPHDFAQHEVEFILGVGGIDIRYGQTLGTNLQLSRLVGDYDAVFVGIGLGGVNGLGIEGETLGGVLNAVDYIDQLRQAEDKAALPVGRDIVVVGGGNTAIDIAVQTRRLGAENVTLVYRRGARNMAATPHEQEIAQHNGVKVKTWAQPIRVVGEGGHVRAVEFEYTQLDGSGRLMGTGEHFTLKADMVFKAVGQLFVAGSLNGSGELLQVKGGKIAVDADGRTSMPKVWAGGDATENLGLTVAAVQDGKVAAAAIDAALTVGEAPVWPR